MDTNKPINAHYRRYQPITRESVAAAEPLTFPEEQRPETLKPIGESAEKPRPVAQFTIHAALDDFPFEVSFTGSADQLAATIRRLRELGAVPPSPAARAAIAAERERSAPICQDDTCDHYNQPMRESTKQAGSYYCPGKTGTKAGKPVYCKSRA